MTGSLTVVGSGIRVVRDMTIGAKMAIENADKVLTVLTDQVNELWIKKINPKVESLLDCYEDGVHRYVAYKKMIKRILENVRNGLNVCVVFYGHPGVFAYPSHESIRQARKEGFKASMLPGISAEDCLFADLNIDPAITGCQSFEATDFLVHKRKFDKSSLLILWQIGVTGNLNYLNVSKNSTTENGIKVLVNYLKEYYESNHQIILYEASPFPLGDPIIRYIPLGETTQAKITPVSTMCILPKKIKQPDQYMLDSLGLYTEKESTFL